ncbi:MAG: CehA/McbA family metallohydrolase [Opitutaceae bacterium]|nr:CehA/McbA family metallohydrolase [Opitutaceae bacterium]
MIPRPLLHLLIAALASVSPFPAIAHDLPYAVDSRPPAPPTIDPGPDAAVLRVRIVDAVTKKPASATVAVNGGNQEPDNDPYREFSLRRSANRHKGAIRSRSIPYYFYTDGRFEVRVPPGPASIEVRKGYEYRPVELTLTARPKTTTDVEIVLERAIDMAALGWYSGDTHIHMDRTGVNDDTLLTVTSAKDIRYAYLLSYNTLGYDPSGAGYESFRQQRGLGDGSLARQGIYHITSGQEYRPTRLGHVTIVLPDRYVPANGRTDNVNRGPSLAVIADQTHALHGFIGLAHGGYFNQEADRLLLERKMDFLELLQFGEYRSLGLEGWYDFLNIGYRLPIVGASDFPPTRELASEMTYAWSDTAPTPRSFAEALAAGRSFATSGPMLFLTVDGQKPGAILRYPEKTDARLTVDIRVQSPQYATRYVELIANGTVVERRFDPAGRSEWSLRHVLPVRASTWIAARTYSDAGTDAHTNPVYVYVGDALPFNATSARQIIARLDGSAAAIPLPEIVARIEALKNELQNLIRDRRSALPLPEIAR